MISEVFLSCFKKKPRHLTWILTPSHACHSFHTRERYFAPNNSSHHIPEQGWVQQAGPWAFEKYWFPSPSTHPQREFSSAALWFLNFLSKTRGTGPLSDQRLVRHRCVVFKVRPWKMLNVTNTIEPRSEHSCAPFLMVKYGTSKNSARSHTLFLVASYAGRWLLINLSNVFSRSHYPIKFI